MPRIQVRERYARILEFEKRHVVGLKEAGWSYRRIALHLSRSCSTIRRYSQEGMKNGHTQRQEGSSRPKETREHEDRAIVRVALTIPYASLSSTVRATSASVTERTIHRLLTERGLRSRRPLRRLPFTSVQCQARLRWCQRHSHSNVTPGVE